MTNQPNRWAVMLLSATLATGSMAASPVQAETPASTETMQVNGTCSGIVQDAAGEPLMGASVRVKDTKMATVTNLDGKFSLINVPQGSTIVVTYIGCKPYEAVWSGNPLDIVLEDNSTALDEVVVVGYGTQKKVNVTGSVSMVGSEAFESRPSANVQQALQGAIPGLNLSQTDAGGELNATMSMNIRGAGTIGDGSVSSPLVLIDGIEGNMNTVNPNDIESVSVLKDAAASSIYGTRAAFGVILITTKSGTAGKVRVSYSGDVRFSTATQLPDMANSLEWATYFNLAQYNTNGSTAFNEETMANIVKYLNGEFTDPSTPEYYGTTAGSDGKWNKYNNAFANTDWFKEFYKENVPSTQHNISLSGGNNKVTWLISGSYLLQNGLIRHGHDEYNRYTTNAKIGAELASWARVDYNVKWTRTDYERPFYMTGLFYHNIARRWPTCPVIDPNGHYTDGMEIHELENMGTRNEKSDMFTQQLRFTFTPLEGWNIVADGALRVTNNKTNYGMQPVEYYDVNDQPFLYDSGYGTTSYVYDYRGRSNYYAVNLFTDYSRSFGKHNGKVLVGLNYEHFNTDALSGIGYDLTNSDKIFLSQAQKDFNASDVYNHRATAGYFGRFNYDYDGKYLFEFNIRYDGSSRFLANRRWEWFPSVSAGWNIAREEFFHDLTYKINTLKPRVSWGRLGNTSSNYNSFWDWYPFYQQQAIGSANSGWLINGNKQNTASLPSIVNGTMTWETIETWNVGLDWGALNNRLTGSFEWFSRTTKDMIGPAPVLGSILGTNAPKTNNCNMRNTGWELEIGWRDRVQEVNYGVRFNISDNRAKILEYPYDGEFESQSLNGWYNGRYDGEVWGYTTHGIANSDEEMAEWLTNNKPKWGSGWQAGDIMYCDLNGDGVVDNGENTIGNHGDLTIIGNTTPRYRFGLNLDIQWRGFDFSAFFQGVMKRDWFFGSEEPYFWGATSKMWQSAVFKDHLDFWEPISYKVGDEGYNVAKNPDAYYPRPYFNTDKNRYTQTRYKQNAAYLRCKNMQFGYSLPESVIRHVGMSNCRFYVSVDNLFTISDISGVFDPEALGGANGAGKLYPLQRTWSVGVNLSF